jgi:flagellar biosynthesis/type III secretory pathway M-ring protein FliF/YscJ
MPILLQGKGLGQLIFVVIFFLIFIILPAIMERLARKKKEERRLRQSSEPKPQAGKSAYQASPGEVKRFLESVGVKTQGKPQRPTPQAPAAPTQARPRGAALR